MADGSVTIEAKLDESKLKKGLGTLSKTLGKVGSGVGKAFSIGTSAIAGVTAGVGAFLTLSEVTQSTREDMGKLETAFTTAGFSSQTAKKSFQGMVGILGETDQSVEAVNHLAQLTDSEEELAEWTNIAAGVYGTFGDSLPLEGLTEAANETAKVGKVTGPLADALNWAGVSEDKFNQQLAACNSEQERATLITQTLSDVYGEAGNTYSEVNKDLIEARQATANFNNALADLGELSMPISTMLKNGFSSAVQSILPDMEMIMGSIVAIFSGENVEETQLAEGMTNLTNKLLTGITQNLPKIFEMGTTILQGILQGIQNNLPQLALGALSIITSLTNFFLTNLPLILNMGMQLIMQLITGINQNIPLIMQSVTLIIQTFINYMTENLPQLLKMGIELIYNLILGIAEKAPDIVPEIVNLIIKMLEVFNENFDKFLMAGIQLILGLIKGLIQSIPTILKNLPTILMAILNFFTAKKLLSAGITLIKGLANGLINGIPQLLKNIPKLITNMVKSIKNNGLNSFKNVGKNLVQGLWNGINNAKDWVWGKISGWCSSIVNNIKSFFGIHSPSKLFEGLGKYLPQGFAIGIDKDSKKAVKSVSKMNKNILSGFDIKGTCAKMQNAINLESGKIATNLSTTATTNRAITVYMNLQGDAYMDSTKVGRMVAPTVSKTIKVGGAT